MCPMSLATWRSRVTLATTVGWADKNKGQTEVDGRDGQQEVQTGQAG